MPISNPTVEHPLFHALETYKRAAETALFLHERSPDPDKRTDRERKLIDFALEVEQRAEYHLRIVMDNYY